MCTSTDIDIPRLAGILGQLSCNLYLSFHKFPSQTDTLSTTFSSPYWVAGSCSGSQKHGMRRFSTAFIWACHWNLTQARAPHLCPFSTNGLFLSDFDQNCVAFLISPRHATCPIHLILLHLVKWYSATQVLITQISQNHHFRFNSLTMYILYCYYCMPEGLIIWSIIHNTFHKWNAPIFR
jgi:hypothetical protein